MVSLLFSILSCWFGGGTLFCCVMWCVLLFAVFSSSSQLSGLISTGYKLGLTSNLSGLVWYSSCRLTPVYFCFSHQIFRALKISAFPVLTLTSNPTSELPVTEWQSVSSAIDSTQLKSPATMLSQSNAR